MSRHALIADERPEPCEPQPDLPAELVNALSIALGEALAAQFRDTMRNSEETGTVGIRNAVPPGSFNHRDGEEDDAAFARADAR